MKADKHFRTHIYNVYFDTYHDELVTASLESSDYKYKIRARSYGGDADKVFFEIKSKLQGVVYKRRAVLQYEEYEQYLEYGTYPDGQTMRELHYIFTKKLLVPKMFIAYDRVAYAAHDSSGLRITFDTNLRSRTHNLTLDTAGECQTYFDDETYIMEVKSLQGMPPWLTDALTTLRMYPTSFSKYGKIYQAQKERTLTHAY